MKNKFQPALGALAVLAGLAGPFTARAVPYASELQNAGGSVSFTLNEGGDVKISFGSTITKRWSPPFG